jgi:hypothetical protein
MKIIRLPLDAQDQAQLLKDREAEPYVKPVLGTATVLAFLMATYVLGFSGWEQLDKTLVGGFFLLFGTMTFFGIGLSKKYFAKNNADSLAGEKEVIVGIITQKEHKIQKDFPDDYYFYIDGEKFVVPYEYYSQFEEGETIAIHRAPISELVLKVEAFQ